MEKPGKSETLVATTVSLIQEPQHIKARKKNLNMLKGVRKNCDTGPTQDSLRQWGQVSWFTVDRCLDKGGLFARHPERYILFKIGHR
ncbi:hypothetical protein TNCV_3323651 [Trichonephila clavipes]|nr:hypothetical protein TNCV_3323651 [Trichonephila clavipes]